ERVEDRALARVGVAGQRDQVIPLIGAQAETHQALGAVLGAGGAAVERERGHQTATSAGAGSRSMRIHSACSRRSAISAPLNRYATGSPAALTSSASISVPRTTP